MKAVSQHTGSVTVALLVGLAMLSGCSQSPKEKYQGAMKQVEQARQDRQDAKQTLEKKQKKLSEAQKAVEQARKKYQNAQRKVRKASSNVDQIVTDPMLFRTIQRKVTQEDAFDDSAISVSVNNRVVRLSGTVPNDDVRQKAVKIARSQPGVKNVVDSLQVKKPQSGGESGGNNNNGGGQNSKS